MRSKFKAGDRVWLSIIPSCAEPGRIVKACGFGWYRVEYAEEGKLKITFETGSCLFLRDSLDTSYERLKAAEAIGAQLWLAGRTLDRGWEVVGIYSSENKAKQACIDSSYFIGPLILDERTPIKTILWPGAYRPFLQDGKRWTRDGKSSL